MSYMGVSRIHSSNSRVYLRGTALKGITKYDFSFDQEVTSLQGLGDYHISNKIKNPNQKIDFSLSWILSSSIDDPFYDFSNQSFGVVSVENFDFKIKDLVGSNSISGAYLTNYSINASVGSLIEGSLKYEADGLFYSTGNNLLMNDQTNDRYDPFLPTNIDVSFSGSANKVNLSGFAIQSFSFEIPITRKPITLLGKTIPSYRYPQLPITAPIKFSVIKNQITGINFSDLILPESSINFSLKDCRSISCVYSFNNVSLKSISESLGIDGNAQVDFNYEASINDTEANRSFYRNCGSDSTVVTNLDFSNEYYSLASIPTFWQLNNTNIASVFIGNTVTSIGSDSFYGCNSLTSVTIPNSVTSIGNYVFYACSLSNVTIPNSVTSIGGGAFLYCYSLTSVTIGNGVTSIGSSTFSSCDRLISVTIGNSVASIGSSAFYNCTSLTSLTIPDSVTSMGNSSFAYCTSLTSITIPNSVTSIGSSAFYRCTSLTSVAIPNSVTSIGDYAFQSCTSLTSVTIPNSVISISNSMFNGCTGLTSVTIPNSVTSIGQSAFNGCTGLTSMTIPNSVTSIGQDAFRLCTSLTSVSIPNSVTSIGQSVFLNCFNLNTLNCFVTRTILNQTNVLLGTNSPFTINARTTDATWTAGADTIGGKAVTVVKNL